MRFNRGAALALLVLFLAAGCIQPQVKREQTPPAQQGPAPSTGPVIPPVAPKSPPAPAATNMESSLWEGPLYSLQYPSNWEVQLLGDLVAFVSPAENAGDFRENVNVFAAALPPEAADTSAAQLFANSFESLQASIEDFRLVEADDQTQLGNEPGVKVAYSGTSKGVPLQFQQRVMVKDGTAYSLTYSGEKTKYGAMAPIIEAMAQSFKLTESTAPQVVGKWVSYGETVFYDSGEREWPDPSNTPPLELKTDRSWTQGDAQSAQGTWDVQAIEEKDWARWNTRLAGASRKIILYGGEAALADGPIEEAGNRVDALWLLYRAGPPAISRPGQVQIKFVRSAS